MSDPTPENNPSSGSSEPTPVAETRDESAASGASETSDAAKAARVPDATVNHDALSARKETREAVAHNERVTPKEPVTPTESNTPVKTPALASSPMTERYVAVTLGNVPVAQRDAAEPALRAAIADEIDHRHDQLLGDEIITRHDIEVDVLEDMGEPEQVAAAMTLRPKVLIGPRFYQDFKYILLWALALAVPVVAVLSMLSAAHQGAELIEMIAHGAGVTVTAAAYVAVWVTLGFAIAERVARHRAEVAAAEWTVDMLPAPARTVISVSQTAIAVVSSLLVAIAVVIQELNPSVFSDPGDPVVFLNPAHWPWMWSALVLVLGINAWAALWRHVRGYWTMRAAMTNVALLTVIYGILAWMLVENSFLNDALFDQVGWPTDQLPPATLENWAAIAVAVLWLVGVTTGYERARRAQAHA